MSKGGSAGIFFGLVSLWCGHERALAIWEQVLGPEHPYVAMSLSNLAERYQAQGRYADAEPLHKRSIAITEKAPSQSTTDGPVH